MNTNLHLSDNEVHEKYYDEIFEHLRQEPYAQFLGIQLTELLPGGAQAKLEIKDHMLNAHQTVHGAVIFALADYVFAAASNSYGKVAVGINTTVNFMSAGMPGDTLTARATEQKKNHKLGWYQIDVESGGTLLASMEALVYRKSDYFIDITN